MPSLVDLGWTDRLAVALARQAEGLVPARVSLEHTHIYRVITDSGEWLARVSGRLRHEAASRAEFPAVGDWVAVEPPRDDGLARIRVVLPRASRFSRRAAGDKTEEQVVAANIDIVFLVVGLDGDYNPRRIERYLLVASDSGATPVVVLNKADVITDPERLVAEVRAISPGVAVHAVSCTQPASLAVLSAHLGAGRTGALLGSSGVGKSTIVNRLVGFDLLATRDVRVSDSRGRHTSTNRQMVLLPGQGILIDTPGMRELQLWETGDAAAGTFADITALAAGCRFRDCAHAVGARLRGGAGGRAWRAARRSARQLPQASGRAGASASPAGPAGAARREAPRQDLDARAQQAPQRQGSLGVRSQECRSRR